ncbi:MAG: hypothetical protein AB2L07_18615 [Thermoanaerobaculaceae bacterium]
MAVGTETLQNQRANLAHAIQVDFVPVYERLQRSLPLVGSTNFVLRALILCVALFALGIASGFLDGGWSDRGFLQAQSFATAVVAAALILFGNAYRSTQEAIVSFSRTFTTEKQYEYAQSNLRMMFTSPWHWVFGLLLGTGLWLVFLLANPLLRPWQRGAFLAMTWLASVLDMCGLWLGVLAMRFVLGVEQFGGFALASIPVKTVGVNRIARLFGTLSLSFSLQAMFSLLAMYLVRWSKQDFIDALFSTVGITVILFAATFIVVPQMVLSGVVRQDRLRRLEALEDEIIREADALDCGKRGESDRLENLERRYLLLQGTRDFPVDLSTLGKFLTSLVFPLFVFLLEHSEPLTRVLGLRIPGFGP